MIKSEIEVMLKRLVSGDFVKVAWFVFCKMN